MYMVSLCVFFFFNDTATTEIYTLSLHDALPILAALARRVVERGHLLHLADLDAGDPHRRPGLQVVRRDEHRVEDRKSTRLNSSHANISYAVFCLKKKKQKNTKYHT